MLIEKKVSNFLDELASAAPTPGGGSVAALAGALGAALVSMVSNLTIGKEKYREVEEEVKKILGSSEKLRYDLSQLIEEDIKAFNNFMTTYKMPKETDEEKKIRSEKIQQALMEAAKVPLQVAYKCLDIFELCEKIFLKGNPNVVSDVGVAILLAEAGLESALLNVEINLKLIKDKKVVEEINLTMQDLILKKKGRKEKILKMVKDKIK